MRKKAIICMMALFVLAAALLPQKKVDAKSVYWYGRYWEFGKNAKKVVKIKGNKVILKGKWDRSTTRTGKTKTKKIKKTFKLTSKTKYYLEDENAAKFRTKVSKKKFKKNLYSDVTYCTFKVKSGKVVKAILSFN